MKRRTFLNCSAAALANIAFLRSARGAHKDDRRIACTTTSFRHRFAATRTKGSNAVGRDLTLLEVPAMFVEQLGLRQVEMWSKHFAETTVSYAEKLRAAAERAGAEIVNVQQDEPPFDLSDPDAEKRRAGVKTIMKWMDLAKACGAPSLRANVGGKPNEPFQLQPTVDSYRRLADYGEKLGVRILVENHGGHSARAENVAAIVKGVNSTWCRSLPDFGNVPAGATADERIAFLNQILPFAYLISAKGMEFNAEYEHTSYDVGSCVAAAEKAGFRGIYSIELWTRNEPPADTVRAVRAMTNVIRGKL